MITCWSTSASPFLQLTSTRRNKTSSFSNAWISLTIWRPLHVKTPRRVPRQCGRGQAGGRDRADGHAAVDDHGSLRWSDAHDREIWDRLDFAFGGRVSAW